MTELPEACQNKNGFMEFAREILKIDVHPHQINSVFNVRKSTETVTKIIFDNVQTKTLFYNAKRLLQDQHKIWVREELTKPRVHLAYPRVHLA